MGASISRLRHQQIFERQLRCSIVAFDLLRGLPKASSCNLGDPQAEGPEPAVVEPAKYGRDLAFLACQSRNHRLQYGGIIGRFCVTFDMHISTTGHVIALDKNTAF